MKKKINLPETQADIKLWKYQKFLRHKDDDPAKQELKMLEIFLGITASEAERISNKDRLELVSQLSGVLTAPPELRLIVTLKGREFGFIPNLDLITFGELVDLDKYAAEWSTMNKALAVLYRPIIQSKGSRYNIEPYSGTNKFADLMKDAPLDIALGSMGFFLSLGQDLTNITLKYLTQIADKATSKNDSIKNGVGTGQLTRSRTQILQDIKELQKNLYTPVLHGSLTKSTKINLRKNV